MAVDPRARLKQWLDSGEAQLHPLTLPQRELWEVCPVPPEDNANHICSLIEIHGLLTERDARAAIQQVVDRQEVLRLSILRGKEQPLQLVRKSSGINFDYRELASNDTTAEAIEQKIAEIFRAPFDLIQGPLYRIADLRRAPDEHVLVLAIHHAIADGWSLGVLLQDLFAAYVDVVMGSTAALPRVPQTYTAWGAAERAYWGPPVIDLNAEFWKTKLANSPRMWKAPITPGPPHRWLSIISLNLANEARELTRQNSVTLFSVLFGAFQIAFAEWNGVDDLVVGTPVANRNRQSARDTMGYYAGIVPLRAQLDRSRTVSDHLRSGHQQTVDSFAHAIPFAELVRVLGERSEPGYNPVFEVRFALQNHPMPAISLPNLSARLGMRSTGTPRFQLACEITEIDEGLEVAWLFRDNLFSPRDIESLDAIFQRVLASICRSPNVRISELLNRPQ